tara:strand:+ start:474 stop:857 length:384 start_codon:yes stop_codon:yes gene_type:complete
MSKAAELAEFGGGISNGPNAVEGLAKSWSNFNGTSTPALRDSFNLSSISDDAAGKYTLSYTSAMGNTNYSIGGMGSRDVGESTSKLIIYDADDTFTASATQLRFISRSDDSSTDNTHGFTQTHGDLA